ncbi:hypothetical protein BpHYR1_042876, partial [Brachionus plicatilis]
SALACKPPHPGLYAPASSSPLLFFHPDLFHKVNQLHLMGHIEEAESDCLFAFKELSSLQIEVFNLDAFLSKNSEWLFNYLNRTENDLFVIFVYIDSYQFPDEDFCLFRISKK